MTQAMVSTNDLSIFYLHSYASSVIYYHKKLMLFFYCCCYFICILTQVLQLGELVLVMGTWIFLNSNIPFANQDEIISNG